MLNKSISLNNLKILITGTAGFIGFHLASKLILEKYDVFGLDIINDYHSICQVSYSDMIIFN